MRAQSLWIGVGLTILSASGFALAFPPASWHPLAWVSLAPWLIALRLGGPGRAFGLTWLWCLAAAYGVGDWFPNAVSSYFHQPMLVAVGLFLAVFTVMAGPYYMAFAWAYRRLALNFETSLPLLAGACWVVAEFGRGSLFTGTAFFIGNPWGLLGYSHADVLPLMQIASLGGIYAASFPIACVNAGVAEVALALGRRRPIRRAGVGLACSALLALGSFAYGVTALHGPGPKPAAKPVTVAVAQGNVAIGSRWRADAYGENLDVYLGLSQAAAERDTPDVVFWPEASMTFFLEDEPLYQRTIGQVLSAHGMELVAGGPVASEDPAGFFNSVFVMEPGGRLTGRYDKQYLVPFAEYFPLRIDVMRRRFGRIRTFQPGAATSPLSTRAGLAGVLLCNEAMLPEAARERVRRGAEYLLNPSNDTWISDPKYSEQQLDISIVRAIEQRRWLVRASTSGPSALVGPFGHVTARTPGDERALIVGEIRPHRARSLYARIGDGFAWACLLLVGGCLLAARWRTSTPRRALTAPDSSPMD